MLVVGVVGEGPAGRGGVVRGHLLDGGVVVGPRRRRAAGGGEGGGRELDGEGGVIVGALGADAALGHDEEDGGEDREGGEAGEGRVGADHDAELVEGEDETEEEEGRGGRSSRETKEPALIISRRCMSV